MLRDFDYSMIQGSVAHRPWAVPGGPWLMTQSWSDLLFAHWPVSPDVMRAKLPRGLEMDLYDGQAWVAVVPFRMWNVSPRAVPPMGGVSAFPELNVRTYVRVNGRPGVWFFSLDAASLFAVVTARTVFHLPYYWATMSIEERDGVFHYHSVRRTRGREGGQAPASLIGTYRPIGPAFEPQPGTFEHFLTERYCLYTVVRDRRVVTVDIQHPPWPLQLAEASFTTNTMAEAAGLPLHGPPPVLHFAKRQDVVSWLPRTCVRM